eukprot:TRINITY_DN3891_c0_g1_i2.p1 TRINITY_DN3891_c0_g1~~TRINITY_DN3891_c0_g1_i2.p1  ORF type:complete len:179 (-),score=33.78 TRINITY_DN3891_c0_g1_i2:40-576(-)
MCIRDRVSTQSTWAPGGWNDPDMLEVGNGKMTTAEYTTHFTLWAMAKSPLLIGCDLSRLSTDNLYILRNKEIIALNQDPLGKQAVCVKNCKPDDFKGSSSHAQITVVELEKGAYGVAVTNWNDKKSFSNIVVNFAELGLPKNKYNVRDLWKHIDMGEFNGQFTVALLESHHTQAFLLK